MQWILLNLPLMVIITGVILTILGVGVYVEYAHGHIAETAERHEREGLYLPHVAQGIRSAHEQSSVTYADKEEPVLQRAA